MFCAASGSGSDRLRRETGRRSPPQPRPNRRAAGRRPRETQEHRQRQRLLHLPQPMTGRETAELVIVGAGGAGMAAALSAVENGAQNVVILEKTDSTGGALNTTSGTMSGARTIIQELDGLTEDTYESYYEDLMEEGSKDGGVPTEYLIRLYSEEAGNTINWLWENGLSEYDSRPTKRDIRQCLLRSIRCIPTPVPTSPSPWTARTTSRRPMRC